MNEPIVSVVLPVYNGADYIRTAIDSVLAQTFADFELIVIDDGSTDATAEIVQSIDDNRLRLIRQKNKGLVGALNHGISLAQGKYIARQDHDDISLPKRFEKQVAYLESHPDCALLGTRSTIWVKDRPTERGHTHPVDEAELRFNMLIDCFIVHSSVIMRRAVVAELGGYSTDQTRCPPEDYELWSRMMRKHKIANLAEPLLIYREVPGSISRTVNFRDKLVKICSENFAYAAGLSGPNDDTQNIAALIHREPLQLSGRPNVEHMCAIVLKAAQNIDQEVLGDKATAQANALIKQLKTMTSGDALSLWGRSLADIRKKLALKYPWLGQLKRRLLLITSFTRTGQ